MANQAPGSEAANSEALDRLLQGGARGRWVLKPAALGRNLR